MLQNNEEYVTIKDIPQGLSPVCNKDIGEIYLSRKFNIIKHVNGGK